MKRWISLVLATICFTGCTKVSTPTTQPGDLPADVVLAWNERVLTLAEAEDRFLTLKGLRTAAMMHLAMHDALNVIDTRYETYLPATPGNDSGDAGDPLAAVAQAAFLVAADQYPDHREVLEADLSRWLGQVADEAARAAGIRTGQAATERILANRQNDGWDREAEYQWHPMAPGVYAEFSEHSGTPEGFIFGAGWAQARPFVLDRPDQFLSPPPPAIESDEYTAAFDEVKSVGRFESAERTADQTHLALWWKEFVESSHNRLARELARQDHLGLWEGARLFALLEVSIYDAYLDVFYNKFKYNHWRPFTAIHWAAHDGNPKTEPDPTWNNTHRHTYPFPSYPSAHGTACASAMTVMADAFGGSRPFTMTNPVVDKAGPMGEKIEMDPPSRSFDAFSEAAMECSMSRVYLGIHSRYDSVEGNRLGRDVGDYVLDHALRPR